MTPSGFNIGIILKMKLSLNNYKIDRWMVRFSTRQDRIYLSVIGITEQEIQQSFHHPRAVRFTGMNTRCDHHPFFHAMLRCIRRWIGDREHVDIVTGQSSTEHFLFTELTFDSIALNLIEIILEGF